MKGFYPQAELWLRIRHRLGQDKPGWNVYFCPSFSENGFPGWSNTAEDALVLPAKKVTENCPVVHLATVQTTMARIVVRRLRLNIAKVGIYSCKIWLLTPNGFGKFQTACLPQNPRYLSYALLCRTQTPASSCARFRSSRDAIVRVSDCCRASPSGPERWCPFSLLCNR